MDNTSSPSTSAASLQPMPQSDLQAPGQTTSLQNAASQSIDAIKSLDQGSGPLAVTGISNSIALPTANTTSTTVSSSAPRPVSHTKDIVLYGGIGLVVLAFVAVLVHGLFYQRP